MKDYKLIKFLSVLDKTALKKVRKMLNSPYFTTNSNLLTLFDLLTKHHPRFDSSKLDKKQLFKKIYKNKKYDDVKFRTLMSNLVRILEEWFIQYQLNKRSFDRQLLLCDALLENSLLEYHKKEIEKTENLLLESKPFTSDHYQVALKANNNKSLANRTGNKPASTDPVHQANDLLEKYYLLQKAEMECEYYTIINIASTEKTLADTVDIARQLKDENPLYPLFLDTKKLHQNRDINLFRDIKSRFVTYIDLLPIKTQLVLMTHLLNFVIWQMKIDDRHFNATALELYKLGLEKKLLIHNNLISSVAYFNIVVCAAKEKKFDWIAWFQKTYTRYLAEDVKDDTLARSDLCLFFHKKEYDKAIELLNKYPFTNKYHKIISTVTGIRCYYELFLIDPSFEGFLTSYAKKFERFLRRDEFLNDDNTKACKHFSKFVRQLAGERSSGKLDLATQQKLMNELNAQELTISRSWLEDKIKQ